MLRSPASLRAAGGLTDRVREELERRTDLLSSWWPAAALGVLAAVLVVVAVRRRRRRRAAPGAGRRAWPVALAAVLTAGLAGGAAVNARLGYFPSVASVQTYATGTVDDSDGDVTTVSVPLRAGSGLDPSDTWVYTPPGYDAAAGAAGTTRYPVVYLFHGEPGSSADWFSAGDVARTADVLVHEGLIPPVILVAPDLTAPGTDDTECLDSTRPGGPQVETHVADVVSWVDEHYATAADPAHRVAAGMSMGAYCAVDLGLRHQDVYGAIIGLEPFGSPGPGGEAALTTRAQYLAVSPQDYLPRLAIAGRLPVYLELAEDGDPLASEETRRMVASLQTKHQPVVLRVDPGAEHDWDFAAEAIPDGLVWTFAQLGWTPPASAAPTSAAPSSAAPTSAPPASTPAAASASAG